MEILRAYGRVRWLLFAKDLPCALAALRSRHDAGLRFAGDPDLARVIGARLGWAVVRVLSVLPTDNRCLMRSLVLTELLARRGIDSKLVIGVDSGSRFRAHAWVEKEGAPLLGTEDVYRRLVEL